MCFLFYKRDSLACDFRKLSLANCDVRSFADGIDDYTIIKNSVISAEEAKKRKEKKKVTFISYFLSLFFKLLLIKTI